jgi:hypothetical protein
MTEAQWLAATDWHRLISHFGHKNANARKARLFAVACCRRLAHLFNDPGDPDPRTSDALALCEQFADGGVSRNQLRKAERAVLTAIHESVNKHGPNEQAWARDAVWRTARNEEVWQGVESCLRAVKQDRDEQAAEAVLFRDLFGNPFRPVELDPRWLTTDVKLLAQGIYDERAFDRMPILADALQDADCTDDAVLNHCREPGEHARGCWVVDLILGKR